VSILKRFWTVMKSNLNHMIGKSEDPEKMLNQILFDMQEQLINAKKQVAVSIADEKRLARQFRIEEKFTKEWEEKAVLAINAGNDSLAGKALDRKVEHAKQAITFNKQFQEQKTSVEALRKALTILSNKISEAKRKKNLLVARAKRAEAQKTISETMSGLSITGANETILRMEQKIDNMEAEAQATSELANEIGTDSLECEFEKLEFRETRDELADLKAKMLLNASSDNEIESKKSNQKMLKEIEEEIKAEISSNN